MRWRAILLVSLGLNLALAVVLWVLHPWLAPRRSSAVVESPDAATNLVRTNVIIRRQFFSWREVESADYPTYIANLRDIGCPESTIRDIIVADVNQLYALKRATEVVTAEQQWWRSEPDAGVIQAAEEKLRALDEERRALLTRLLGPNWEVGGDWAVADPTLAALRMRQSIALDGPVLGLLTADAKQAVRELVARQEQKVQDYLAAQRAAGQKPDPAEVARLRQGTRDELAKLLTPPQLEEYLLRYSDNAQELRSGLGQLKYFNATPDEFRNLFRAEDQIDQQIKLYYSGDDPASVQQRAALEQQREEAIKVALGPQRYEEYRRLQDPAFRDAMAAASQAGQPDAAQTFYEISQATAQQRNAIQADDNLTAQQKEIELKRMELEQAKANAQALGQSVPEEPPTPAPLRMVHVIEPGETVNSLAARYGLSIRDIVAANANVNFTALKPGDSVFVPTGQPSKP